PPRETDAAAPSPPAAHDARRREPLMPPPLPAADSGRERPGTDDRKKGAYCPPPAEPLPPMPRVPTHAGLPARAPRPRNLGARSPPARVTASRRGRFGATTRFHPRPTHTLPLTLSPPRRPRNP